MCLGIPGKIVNIRDPDKRIATVDVSGVKRDVNVACVSDKDQPLDNLLGEWVLVHVGFAMSKIKEKEAQETLKILEELGEAQEEIRSMQRSGMREST